MSDRLLEKIDKYLSEKEDVRRPTDKEYSIALKWVKENLPKGYKLSGIGVDDKTGNINISAMSKRGREEHYVIDKKGNEVT